jgi:hypothetical protein
MPPSPSLSTRIANATYLTDVMISSVQTISDSDPSRGRRWGMVAGYVEHGLQCIEWTGAYVAEDDAKCRKAHCSQPRVGRLARAAILG